MDPQQELFTKLKLDIEALGYDVYDGALPPDGTPYPFIYLGNSQTVDEQNKTGVLGRVFQIVHVWHNDVDNRGSFSEILRSIKRTARLIEMTDNYGWMIRHIDTQILPDDTTKHRLLHGVIELEYQLM